MYTIEHLSHTADVRLRLRGDSPEALFTAGFAALNDIIKPGACTGAGSCPIIRAVAVRSVDTTALLVDFLSDVLTLIHEEKAVFCKLQIQTLTPTAIEAQIEGIPAGGFHEDVKAVTYHEAEVRRRGEGQWETMLIFDI